MPATLLAVTIVRDTSRASLRRGLCCEIPSVAPGGTSPLYVLQAQITSGDLYQLDLAAPAGLNAAYTLWLFSRDGVTAGSLYTIAQVGPVTGDAHPVLAKWFLNQDVPQAPKLYLQVKHVGGTDATGVLGLTLWMQP